MSELANYSIETDRTVLLAFADGRRLRVPIGQLAHYLAPPDLERVRASLRLRRDFIRDHMPKALLALIGAGLIALLTVGGKTVADMFVSPRHPQPVQSQSKIVRNQLLPNPSASPTPSSASAPAVAVATPAPAPKSGKHATAAATIKPAPLPKPTALPTVTPIVSPQPSVSPSPTPSASPTPTPTPTTSPSASDSQGMVAGCSTSVADPNNCPVTP
jgi:hypothetical protein